jgi:plastocyanin
VAAALGLLGPAAFVGCSSGTGSPSSSTPKRLESGSVVRIKLIAFNPAALEVPAGTTVTWRQGDPGSHTVTSGTVEPGTGGVSVTPDDTFGSGELTTDEAFDFTFAERGTYPYYCEIHPATMRGEITVR